MRIGPPSQRSQPQFRVLEVCLAGGGAWISFQMQYIQPLADARISDKFLWESPVLDFCGGKWPSPPLKCKFCYSLKKVLGVQRPGRFISLLSITVQKPRGEISLLEDRKGFSFFWLCSKWQGMFWLQCSGLGQGRAPSLQVEVSGNWAEGLCSLACGPAWTYFYKAGSMMWHYHFHARGSAQPLSFG